MLRNKKTYIINYNNKTSANNIEITNRWTKNKVNK